ncbi:MAG: HEAT repeat domain-containing protein [Fimbriimonadaceae bacterium]
MKTFTAFVITLLAAAILAIVYGQGGASRQDSKSGTPPAPQIPQRLTSLTDLQLLRDMTLLSRLEWYVQWLAEEKRLPSKTTTGIGGGAIDSGYIQQQLVRSMAGGGDPRGLKWLVNSGLVKNREFDLEFRLALGLLADQTQKDVLISTVTADPNPNHRLLAASGLGRINARDAFAALRQVAANDPYYVNYVGSNDPKTREYPVRKKAESALRMIEDVDADLTLKDRVQKLNVLLADYEAFVAANIDTLRRIAGLTK